MTDKVCIDVAVSDGEPAGIKVVVEDSFLPVRIYIVVASQVEIFFCFFIVPEKTHGNLFYGFKTAGDFKCVVTFAVRIHYEGVEFQFVTLTLNWCKCSYTSVLIYPVRCFPGVKNCIQVLKVRSVIYVVGVGVCISWIVNRVVNCNTAGISFIFSMVFKKNGILDCSQNCFCLARNFRLCAGGKFSKVNKVCVTFFFTVGTVFYPSANSVYEILKGGNVLGFLCHLTGHCLEGEFYHIDFWKIQGCNGAGLLVFSLCHVCGVVFCNLNSKFSRVDIRSFRNCCKPFVVGHHSADEELFGSNHVFSEVLKGVCNFNGSRKTAVKDEKIKVYAAVGKSLLYFWTGQGVNIAFVVNFKKLVEADAGNTSATVVPEIQNIVLCRVIFLSPFNEIWKSFRLTHVSCGFWIYFFGSFIGQDKTLVFLWRNVKAVPFAGASSLNYNIYILSSFWLKHLVYIVDSFSPAGFKVWTAQVAQYCPVCNFFFWISLSCGSLRCCICFWNINGFKWAFVSVFAWGSAGILEEGVIFLVIQILVFKSEKFF